MNLDSHLVEVKIADSSFTRLDKALAAFAPVSLSLSRSYATRLIRNGAVSLNGITITEADYKVLVGQVWNLIIPEITTLDTVPQNIPLDIVFEDNAIIIVNKPAGMVVHPAPGSSDNTLVNALLYHCMDTLSGIGGERRPGIVHRIDKDTSGLLIVAKSDLAHHELAKQFEKHIVKRKYLALCYGCPDAADPRLLGVRGVGFERGNILKIVGNLSRHRYDRQRQAVVKFGGRHAITRARVLQKFGMPEVISLIECWLETGRTHQIRTHLSYVGHSLIGDPIYGSRRKIADNAISEKAKRSVKHFSRQALHATELGFIHPISKKPMHFSIPLPVDISKLIYDLKTV
jgi:23S rRNA pseudouridine1911/1915/1917 synthase